MKGKLFLVSLGAIIAVTLGIKWLYNVSQVNTFKFDTLQGVKIQADLVQKAVSGLLRAEKNRNFEEMKQFASSNFVEKFDRQKFLGTSNPHISRFDILGIRFVSKNNAYESNVRVWKEYTGYGDIGYSDNLYYVKSFDGRYLVDSVIYRKFVNTKNIYDEKDKPDNFQIPPKKNNFCPTWVNCMPGPDIEKRCIIPAGCENYTQKTY